MALQRNLEVKGGKVDRHQRDGYVVLVQHATDWDGPCFHLHMVMEKPFSKSMYRDILNTFDDICYQYFEHPIKTVLEPDEKQIRLVNHLGFEQVAVLTGGYLYYEWVEMR